MDRALAIGAHGLAGKSFFFDSAVALVGSLFPYIFVIASCAAFFIVSRRSADTAFRRRAWFLHRLFAATVGLLASLGIVIPLTRLFYAPVRPFVAFGWKPLIAVPESVPSFPSGHATAFFFLAALLYQSDRKKGAWALAGAVAISLARVMAGIHFPGDIFWGALLGLSAAAFVGKFLPPLRASERSGIY